MANNLDTLTLVIFFVMIGILLAGIQISYNTAIEYREMRHQCAEYGLIPLENGTLYQYPTTPTTPTSQYKNRN